MDKEYFYNQDDRQLEEYSNQLLLELILFRNILIIRVNLNPRYSFLESTRKLYLCFL